MLALLDLIIEAIPPLLSDPHNASSGFLDNLQISLKEKLQNISIPENETDSFVNDVGQIFDNVKNLGAHLLHYVDFHTNTWPGM